jgi:hypothetical protein
MLSILCLCTVYCIASARSLLLAVERPFCSLAARSLGTSRSHARTDHTATANQSTLRPCSPQRRSHLVSGPSPTPAGPQAAAAACAPQPATPPLPVQGASLGSARDTCSAVRQAPPARLAAVPAVAQLARVHSSRLPAATPPFVATMLPSRASPPPAVADGAERVVGHRKLGNGYQYEIKWHGSPETTWEAASRVRLPCTR